MADQEDGWAVLKAMGEYTADESTKYVQDCMESQRVAAFGVRGRTCNHFWATFKQNSDGSLYAWGATWEYRDLEKLLIRTPVVICRCEGPLHDYTDGRHSTGVVTISVDKPVVNPDGTSPLFVRVPIPTERRHSAGVRLLLRPPILDIAKLLGFS